MKQLCLLNQDTNIKLGDTDTQIQFSAFDDNQPVSITSSQSATFRIKNSFGFLKSVDATTTYNGSIYQLDTAQLTGLVPGVYQIELAIYLEQSNPQIYPDEGFCQFTITPNALSVIGEQLPIMSLDDFKKQIQDYTNQQVESAENSITNNFQQYVDKIQNNALSQASEALTKANQAMGFANYYTLDDVFGGKINGMDVPSDFNHIKPGIYGGNGWSSVVNSQANFPNFVSNKFFLLEIYNAQDNFYVQKIYTKDAKVYEQILGSDYTVLSAWNEISATSTNTVIQSIDTKVSTNTKTISDINSTLTNYMSGTDLTTLAGKKINSFDQLTQPGVYCFNAWTSNVSALTNIPFTNCWGSVMVFPFGNPESGNVIQIAINDKNVIKYRTAISSSFSNWHTVSVTP